MTLQLDCPYEYQAREGTPELLENQAIEDGRAENSENP